MKASFSSSSLITGACALTALLGLMGCPNPVSSSSQDQTLWSESTSLTSDLPTSTPSPSFALQLNAEEPELSGSSVATSVCASAPNWQRPSATGHLKYLESMPRYGTEIHTATFQTLLSQFRENPVIHFTTYGLSARTEPIYMSGLWSALDQLWDCYEGSAPEQINAGELGELWLMGHALESMEWNESGYILTLRTAPGLQIVQFERQEEAEGPLPIQVVTLDGTAVANVSGDR